MLAKPSRQWGVRFRLATLARQALCAMVSPSQGKERGTLKDAARGRPCSVPAATG